MPSPTDTFPTATLLPGREPHPALGGFHAPTQTWFTHSFEAPTRAQELAWPVIQAGQTALILAPTGSGKTLAAFLAAIDRLMFDPVPDKKERCRVLYISPLKALAVDVERNLRAPLVGVSRYAERMDHPFHLPEVAIRTGDTPSRERAQFQRTPADILITTPESLYLLLTSNARDVLRSVRTVIIDEIHAMVGTKRGAHLALSLERLEAWTGCPLQRVGLSATVRPVEEAARFLGGFAATERLREGEIERERDGLDRGPEDIEAEIEELDPDADHPFTPSPVHPLTPRPVAIADAGRAKKLDLTVEIPVEDMAKLGQVQEIPSGPAAQGEVRTSIWPAIHPLILELIRQHRSTLIFVNSRRLAERLAGALNELAGEEIVRAHHGSIAREQRMQIEDDLKAGRLPGLVATSSLELGIDMGAIDLVVQVEAPPSVASAVQRIGRAGHQIDAPSKGIIIPKFRGDLLACAALTGHMQQGNVEPLRYPRNPLDVLAQQIVGMVAMDEWRVEELERVVRRAAPFTDLPRSMLDGVLDMLSGRYPSDDFAELRPRLTWDRLAGTLRSREGAKRIAVANAGSIPDRGLYGVYLIGETSGGRGPSMRVGELDEEMVFETHVGETFILGASTWRVEEITHDRVVVSPAPGVPGKMPFWHGDRAARPLEFGRAIGALCRTLREVPRAEALQTLTQKHSLTEGAARNLMQYLDEQAEATGVLPDDRTLVVERYLDEMGDWRVCLLSPFGSRVHAPWAMAISAMIAERSDVEVDILWTDDGIVARFPEADEPPPVEIMIPDPDEVEDQVIRQLATGGAVEGGMNSSSALFASRFREAAGRALLLPRRYPGQRSPLWQQRKRSADLLRAAAQYRSFPIILEAYRECLRDVFDMPALIELLREVRRRTVRTVAVTTRSPSPFASALMFNYVASFIYGGDAPLAERRAQALAVDQSQLRELLGEVELRELLDPEALDTLELQLQHLTEERRARHPDALHDLLIRLGDLDLDEVRSRVSEPEAAEGWLERLRGERRVILLTIGGEQRYVAAEDAGRFRDALGIPPPPGLPVAFLEFARDPLGDLVARYARTHGPFRVEDVAARFGIGVGPVLTLLKAMEASGRVVQGEFRPGGSGREWCEAGVLRSLRQKSLAKLRHEVEPVEPAALGRLYVAWQGIGGRRRGGDGLIEVIEQLQGAPVPASELEARILPARVGEYDPRELDTLTASGSLIWVGCESLGERDGRVGLYLVEHAPLLLAPRPEGPDGPLHRRIREHLAERGASFFAQLMQASGGAFQPDVLSALWDLVWASEVTNDTLAPLRAYLSPRRRPSPRRGGYGSLGLRSRALFPPEAAGRWSLVSSFLYGQPSPTERLAARSRQLLDRYGVVTREAIAAEGIEGGFSAIYPVLRRMEEAGHIRRGYFVAGRGATQFALPGAVDRLRGLREPEEVMHSVLLAATDPANPYGAALPWPEREEGRRPSRSARALVILTDGALAAWMGRAERQLVTFPNNVPERDPEEVAEEIARTLAQEVTSGRRRAVFVKEVDGAPAQETPMALALVAAGFTFGPHGYMRRA
jgi:ATP-dependent Lhr-like helicase